VRTAMRVMIVGRTEFLLSSARLIAGDHTIAGVLTAPSSPENKATESDFEQFAREQGAAFRSARRIDADIVAWAKSLNADIAVSMNWVSVMREDFCSLFRFGVLNAHLGDLPRYRGNAVINWAMLNGENEIALTIHKVIPDELDSGPIAAQRKLPLDERTTVADVLSFCIAGLPELYRQVVTAIGDGTQVWMDQDKRGLTPFRCYPRIVRDGRIDWSGPAIQIDALIRSLARPYPGAYTYYRIPEGALHKLFVWKSRLVSAETADLGVAGHVIRNDPKSGESWIYTGSGVIALCEVSHESDGYTFKPGHVWRSIRMRLGMDVEEELFRLATMRERG
jgi:methionyl-tRNA formyltransferase